MTAVTVTEILRGALSLYREALPVLARHVLPVLAIAQAIDMLPWSGNPLLFLLLALLSSLAIAWASAYGLHVMLRLRVGGARSSLSAVSLALFILVGAYLTLTTSLGVLLFIVPALVVVSAAVLAPVFALEHHHGPFQAVASSTDCTKGSLLPITGAVLLAWLAITIAGVLLGTTVPFLGFASVPVANAGSVILAFAGLFHYAIVVVLFERLHPNPPLQGTPAAKPAAPPELARWASI